MSLQITFYERTGSPFFDEEVFNMNWKNQGLKDSLYKYYYYPIRRPEDPDWVTFGATKYLYATITGTYDLAKRVRWKITGLPMTDGVRCYLRHTSTYTTPSTVQDGSLIYAERDPLYLFPNISDTAPTAATGRNNNLTNPGGTTTYYTDFLCSQLWVDDTSGYVGNTDLLEITLEVDEYE